MERAGGSCLISLEGPSGVLPGSFLFLTRPLKGVFTPAGTTRHHDA